MTKGTRAACWLAAAGIITALAGCEDIKNAFSGKPLVSAPKSTVATSSASGASTSPVQGTVLAKVNNDVITLELFDEKLRALKALSPDFKADSYDAKKNYLNDLITQELVFQEARSRGIDKKKDIRDAVEEFRKGVMARQLIMDETKGVNVEPSEIQTFYNQYKQAFVTPQEAHVREIVVPTESSAREILIGLLNGGDFASLAQEKSKASSAAKGGDLGFYRRESKFEKFNSVVATLEQGQVSQIFSGPDGYYIVKVEEKRGGSPLQLTDKMPGADVSVYDQIKEGLLQQKQAQRIQDLTDRIKREAKIEIKEELLR